MAVPRYDEAADDFSEQRHAADDDQRLPPRIRHNVTKVFAPCLCAKVTMGASLPNCCKGYPAYPSAHRFVLAKIPTDDGVAFDTQTGQLCRTWDWKPVGRHAEPDKTGTTPQLSIGEFAPACRFTKNIHLETQQQLSPKIVQTD